MASGLSGIVEAVMSVFVEAGGAGVRKGGGGLLMGAARSIGWAKRGGGGGGGRIAGHSMGGHAMGTGFGRGQDLTHYNPKTAHLQQMSAHYGSGAWSGSGLAPPRRRETRPAALHGRSSFDVSNSLNGNPNRYVRGGAYGGGGYGGGAGFGQTPRSFIRFNK